MLSKQKAWTIIAVLSVFIILIGVAIQQQLVYQDTPAFEQEVIVYGLEVDGVFKAYPEKYLVQQLSFTEEVNGISIRMINDEGTIIFQDTSTRADIPTSKMSLADWQELHPDSLLY